MRAAELLRLARTLYDDATERVEAEPSFPLLLDQALLAVEFSRALDEDFEPRLWLSQALGMLRSAGGTGPWLYRGAAQAGWTAIQVADFCGTEVAGLAPIDEIALRWIVDYPETMDVDLPMGLLGLGVYGLAHPDAAAREKLTSGVLDVIDRRAERDGDALFFRVNDTEPRRREGSVGCRLLGMAHGAAGIVSYLASAALSDTGAAARARTLLDEAVAWLLRWRSDDFPHGVFPHRVETRYQPARPTWCSGDPGVALALSVAARATGSAELTELVCAVAAKVVSQPPEHCRVLDGCMCHGAAGLCWFGTRMHADFGVPGASEFAAHWAGHLDRERAAGPLRYFCPAGMMPNASFLEGDAGAALALLHAATGVPPCWEELLLATPISPRNR
ncbi:lanthionine synthetase LanC family protein [Saccharopolyspora spinosa]|uniref:Lanthionine synthetase-like protein n=1 Tax=Saccharopolyspora spinosa TaxID=60894 RepID=A0A2N3XZQ0_SACSN|nr:lanthionine synthetase LanC family protein [Saccharopolyspora spinosa]PKW16100.1 lanthionine synthetase-like protein [Saccharopolyspora spinosa]